MDREFVYPIEAQNHLRNLAKFVTKGVMGKALAQAFTLNHQDLETKPYNGRK